MTSPVSLIKSSVKISPHILATPLDANSVSISFSFGIDNTLHRFRYKNVLDEIYIETEITVLEPYTIAELLAGQTYIYEVYYNDIWEVATATQPEA